MDRVNNILNDIAYNELITGIKHWENKREFCKHNMRHFLDVARIAYIMVLEREMNVKKDVIYAIGLLHDIGRGEQYEKKIPHEAASARLAPDILQRCGYTEEEIRIIISCILNHRNKENKEGTLEEIIYRADKLSRPCYSCKAEKKCDWDRFKKNMGISI